MAFIKNNPTSTYSNVEKTEPAAGWAPNTLNDQVPTRELDDISKVKSKKPRVDIETSLKKAKEILQIASDLTAEDQPKEESTLKIEDSLEPLDNHILDILDDQDILNTRQDELDKRLEQISQKLNNLDYILSGVPSSAPSSVSISKKNPDLFLDKELLELEKILNKFDQSYEEFARAAEPTTIRKEATIAPEHLHRVHGNLYHDPLWLNLHQPMPVPAVEKPENVKHFEQNYLSERDNEMSLKPKATKNGWSMEADGDQKHYVNGVLHRDNGPAEIRADGTQLYYRNGKLHRDGGLPAFVGVRGAERFAVDGKYHRVGGLPAKTWVKGPYRQEWWENGEIIRALRKDGSYEYYAPGSDDRETAKLHRTDGPAVIHANGNTEYWLNGNHYPTLNNWLGALEKMNAAKSLEKGLIDEDPIDNEEMVDTVRTVETKEKKKMSKPSFTEMMKTNAVSAGYRVAGTQLTTLVKNAVLTVMRNKGADGGAIQAFSSFLDTEFGNAMISFAIGSGLNYVPHFSDDPRVQRLAEEMSVAGMAIAGNAVIGEAMQHVLPAVSTILQNLPSADGKTETASNVRVIETEAPKSLAKTMEEEVGEEEAETTTAKTMSV